MVVCFPCWWSETSCAVLIHLRDNTGLFLFIFWLTTLVSFSSLYRHHLVQCHEYSCIVFAQSFSCFISCGFDLTVLYSASLLVLYISACTLHLCSLYMTVSLLLLYTLYSAFICDLVARMVLVNNTTCYLLPP